MSDELKDMLQSVIIDSLKPIQIEFQELNNEVTSIKDDVAKIKKHTEDIPAMKIAILETNKTVKRIESTQEKHERTLDLLSRDPSSKKPNLRELNNNTITT